MLTRKIETEIIKWLKNSKTALLIDGARQVGKTTTIEKVLREQGCDFVTFNLLEDKSFRDMLSNIENISKNEFLENLTASTTQNLTKGKTIIFIDEIQICKELLTIVKFLVQEGSYRYIFSGSVLGITLQNLRSAPVGYLSIEKMYPMDFEEFTKALGTKQETIDCAMSSFNSLKPVPEIVHTKLMENFKKYLVIGGMPAAVQSFVENRDYNEVHKIHQNIIEMNKNDFAKYQNNDKKLKLMAAYELIPSELNGQNKRYVFKDLNSSFRFERYESTFEWFSAAEVAIPIYNVASLEMPLIRSRKSTLFKLFLNDVGLLTSMYGIHTIRKIINKESGINFGALYENYVAQELHAHGYEGYYYNSKKFGELDFVIEEDNKVIPIEVKSGKDYLRHCALNNVMSNKSLDIEKAFVFTNDNVS